MSEKINPLFRNLRDSTMSENTLYEKTKEDTTQIYKSTAACSVIMAFVAICGIG